MRRGPKRERSNKRLGRDTVKVVAIATFVVLDILLVAAAIQKVNEPVDAPASRTVPQTDLSSVDGSPARASDASDAESPTPAGTSGPVLLALASDGTVVRAEAGDCSASGSASVSFSTDAGASFEPASLPEEPTAVLGLDAPAPDDLRAVATVDDCTTVGFAGGVGGSWKQVDEPDVWHLLPGDAERVQTPSGPTKAPCAPAAVSAGGAVRLLCEDGRLFGTADDGDSWAALGRLEGAVAIAFDGPGDGVALMERQQCEAAVMTTENGGSAWAFTDCLEGGAPRGIALRGDTAVAQAGDTVFVSDDGGASWSPAG